MKMITMTVMINALAVMKTMMVIGKKLTFTKESVASAAFPHQVHGPGQGTGVGESPRVHVSGSGSGYDRNPGRTRRGQRGKDREGKQKDKCRGKKEKTTLYWILFAFNIFIGGVGKIDQFCRRSPSRSDLISPRCSEETKTKKENTLLL